MVKPLPKPQFSAPQTDLKLLPPQVGRIRSKILDVAREGNIDKLRQLFDAFSTKRDLLHLLDQSLRADGLQIFIGGESGYQPLEECSVVTAPYRVDGQIVGTLGVIGPTRMAYEHVIPIVDMTARLLGGALSAQNASPTEGA